MAGAAHWPYNPHAGKPSRAPDSTPSASMVSLVSSRPARIATAATCALLICFYVYTVLRIWRADWLQDQHDQQSLEASARLEPWDARTHWLLGRYFLNVPQDQTRALANFHRAVNLDPFEGRYWLDLAAAYEIA